MLLKQLVPPLSTQLSDRRSTIVKQVLSVAIYPSFFLYRLFFFKICYFAFSIPQGELHTWHVGFFFKLKDFSLMFLYPGMPPT